MYSDHYVNFVADVRKRDEQLSYANEHRMAKAIPTAASTLVSVYRQGLANLGALLYNLGSRLLCQHGSALKSLDRLEFGCE